MEAAEEPEPAQADWLQRWIWILTGVMVFLIGLILAVSAGRYVRALRTANLEKEAELLRAGGAQPASPNAYAKSISQLRSAKDPVARYKALEYLVGQGPSAVEAALESLVQTSEDGNLFQIPEGAVAAWVEMGSAGVPTLLPALESKKSNVRAGAAYILSQLGGQAKAALRPLANLLEDPHPRVRWYALEALAGLGPAAAEALEKLTPLLEHPDRLTRRRALLVLARIGPKAKMLLPQVQKLAKEDPDMSVRQMAELAVRQLNLEALADQAAQDASEELQPLIERLRGGNPYEAVAAAQALAKLGPKAAEALPVLALALYHPDKWVREAAVRALGAIGPQARTYRDPLVAATLDVEPEVRQAAQEVLDQIDGRKPKKVP
ncbi:MAG: HEAT repeat domain-containing protein [Thermoguttaceae bacterium]|nr:HEAT repeat domain-containing protein [Thermoguttaceae bacterium]MDW8037160.1 HEAT repeat domain-containing protein [Thermoguttaceae bacterium]